MDKSALIGATLTMLSLAGGVIGIYVAHEKKLALAKQENLFTKQELEKLEQRVVVLENNVYKKIEAIFNELTAIKVAIAKNN